MLQLTKGGRINLSKDEDGNQLDKIFFGTKWGMIRETFGLSKTAVNLNFSSVLLDVNGNRVDIVYYGHKDAPGIHYYKDNLTGDVNGDDGMDNETMELILSRINPSVEYIFFVLNSFKHQKFDRIPYIGIRIYTSPNNRPKERISDPITILAQYSLKNIVSEFAGRESIILGEAYKRNGEWKFKAIGEFGNIGSISDFPVACKRLI